MPSRQCPANCAFLQLGSVSVEHSPWGAGEGDSHGEAMSSWETSLLAETELLCMGQR